MSKDDILPEDFDSNLVRHARRELELIGEDPNWVEGYLDVIRAFAKMGHSGGSASVAIPTIHQLLQFKNLSELTNDPEEWSHISGDIWQSNRDSEAFSNDGGRTYYLLSEGGNDKNRYPLRVSAEKKVTS